MQPSQLRKFANNLHFCSALSTQKFGGKRMPPEQFVLRKVALYEGVGWDRTLLLGLEIMALSNMTVQMGRPSLEKFRAMVDALVADMEAKGSPPSVLSGGQIVFRSQITSDGQSFGVLFWKVWAINF
jgi:hypothetical protein